MARKTKMYVDTLNSWATNGKISNYKLVHVSDAERIGVLATLSVTKQVPEEGVKFNIRFVLLCSGVTTFVYSVRCMHRCI